MKKFNPLPQNRKAFEKAKKQFVKIAHKLGVKWFRAITDRRANGVRWKLYMVYADDRTRYGSANGSIAKRRKLIRQAGEQLGRLFPKRAFKTEGGFHGELSFVAFECAPGPGFHGRAL